MTELICEVGINANGDLELAKKLIDVAHSAGCQYVKFQKRTIDQVYTQEFLDSPRKSPWGTTQREQKEGLEFDYNDYCEIERYCSGKIGWFASPWDIPSIKFLQRFNPPFIKIASAMLTNKKFVMECYKTKIPLIVSTGMCTMEMIKEYVWPILDNVYCLMHCTSTYPSKDEELNLKCIQTLKEEFPSVKIGYSSHHPGVAFIPVAIALGAEMVEVHITLDRAMYGSDQAASIEPEGIFKLAKYAKGVSKALGDGIKRITPAEEIILKKLRAA